MTMIERRRLLGMMASAPLVVPGLARGQDMSRIAMAPIHVRDSRVWMPVRFGGGETHSFILDTGGFANLISTSLADQLDLRRLGSLRIAGVGGRDRYDAYRAPDVSIGDVRVGAITFAAYPPQLVIHPQARGALSAGLLTVADSDLDFDAGQWRLYLDGRRDRTGFTELPTSIMSQGLDSGAAHIFIDVEMGGRSYHLIVDTGAPGDLMLDPDGTARSGLWTDSVPYAPHRRMGIGGIIFERPLVSITDPEERRSGRTHGLLGIGVIERLNLSTDIRARRLWAKRNNRTVRPERYGMSGLWLAERRGGLVIAEVGTGSPAAEAGLRIGDVVTGGSLQEWIRRLAGRPGDRVEVPVARGGASRTVTLTLREYL